MIKKKVFIGSSSEELPLAEAAKSILAKDFDVVIWNESLWETAVFKINNNYLSDLLKASLKFDFGLLIGTKDDKIKFRGENYLQPRDNILFELGLFIGRLGLNNCAFLIDKNIKVLTDLNGISLARFDKNNSADFITNVNKIRDFFLASVKEDINFFPSTTLASVYFENLIRPVCKYLIENNGHVHDKVNYSKCRLTVIVPDRITSDINLQFEKLKSKFETENVTFMSNGRPRNITIDKRIKDETIEFIDFPTIVSGINHAISNLLPNDFNSFSNDYKEILDRELRRFVSTLKRLLIQNEFDDMVTVIRESEISK